MKTLKTFRRNGKPALGADRIERAIREILTAIGENPDREGLARTPQRVARMYREILNGHGQPHPDALLSVTFDESHHEMVIAKEIPFYSLCEHHMLPFFGKAHIAYVPNGRIVGISKLARTVEAYSRRLQVQERLTSQIAELINEKLRPQGVGVILEASHMCMVMRGVQKPGTQIVTSAMRGVFQRNVATRMEFLSLISSRAAREI